MNPDREEACEPALVPDSLAHEVRGYAWARNCVGQAGAAVYRLHGKPGGPDLYLKHGHNAVADDLMDEAERLRWLAGHVSAPAVKDFIRTPDEAWLLMTALPGQTAYQVMLEYPESRPAIVDALADFLRALHSIPVTSCPFTSDVSDRLGLARQRIDARLVNETNFDDERQGWSAEQVWEELQKHLPFLPDPVVTHGDFSLENLLVEGEAVVGCIDAGRLGVADRYQDLAILLNSLGEFDEPLKSRFLARYGIDEPDERKLLFHVLLDELF